VECCLEQNYRGPAKKTTGLRQKENCRAQAKKIHRAPAKNLQGLGKKYIVM
jgi:hypothetical protein